MLVERTSRARRPRLLAIGALALGALLFGVSADRGNAQGYPSKPIRLIVPFPPGGTTDFLGRLYAGELGKLLGQTVFVENRGGANTIVGATAAAQAPPDGYTLLMAGASTLTTNPLLHRDLPYHPQTSFTAVSGVAYTPYVIVANPAFAAGNLADLIAYAKANPGKVTYGTPGVGSFAHLAIVRIERLAGIQMLHVPYKGGNEALMDVLGGRIDLIVTGIASVSSNLAAGKVKAIAIGSELRMPDLPNVPTIAESGFPSFQSITWFSLIAPASTPDAIVEKVSTAVAKIGRDSTVIATLRKQGYLPFEAGPAQLRTFIATEMMSTSDLVKSSGIQLE